MSRTRLRAGMSHTTLFGPVIGIASWASGHPVKMMMGRAKGSEEGVRASGVEALAGEPHISPRQSLADHCAHRQALALRWPACDRASEGNSRSERSRVLSYCRGAPREALPTVLTTGVPPGGACNKPGHYAQLARPPGTPASTTTPLSRDFSLWRGLARLTRAQSPPLRARSCTRPAAPLV